MLHTLIQYALLEILRCWSFSFSVAPSSSWGFSHAPKSLQHFCVCTTFARLEYFFYLTRIYCEKLRRVPSYFAPPLVPFTIYLPIPLALRYLTRFLHTRCVFQVLKNVCLLCCATPRFVFIKRNIFSIALSSMCCTVLYIHIHINDICLYIFCCSWQRLLDFCCCLQSLNFSLPIFMFCCFCFRFVFFFALLGFFREISQKSLNAPSPARPRKEEQAQAQAQDSSSTFMRPRRQHGPKHEEQKRKNSSSSNSSRQHATARGRMRQLSNISSC